MTPKAGQPLSVARAPREARFDIVDALVVAGAVVSLGLIAASATLNFRMAFRSADNELDGWAYGSAAALGECLKAMTPFAGNWAWRNREFVAAAAALLLFTALTAYSFSSALGFSAQHRSSREAAAERRLERHGDLRDERQRVRQRLTILGNQRLPQEVEMAIEAVMRTPAGRSTVADVSSNCTLNRTATRVSCAELATLNQELVRAKEAAELEARLTSLQRRLSDEKGDVTTSPDPQIDALSYLGRLVGVMGPSPKPGEDDDRHRQIGFVLSVVMALFMELGSGLGLYLSTAPWRGRKIREQVERSGERPALRTRLVDMDDLESFVLECLEPYPGARLMIGDLYLEYRSWCLLHRKVVFGKSLFERLLKAVAAAGGIVMEMRGGQLAFMNVRLAEARVVYELGGD